MILLVSASSAAERVAHLLQQRLEDTVQTATSIKQARSLARVQPFAVVVLDESSVDVESGVEPAEPAIVVSANLAIHDAERVAREVKRALQRAQRERSAAGELAARELRAHLKEELTNVLLAAELAANDPDLPSAAEDKINQVLEAVQRLRQRLG